jgi:hypothetical protein
MTAQELAQHVMVDRGLNTADKRLLQTMTKRAVRVCGITAMRGFR